MGPRCKGRGSGEQVKNGLMRGEQRYRRKGCGLNFADTPPRGMPPALKATAVLLCVSGLSMDRTAKPPGASTPSVQAWIGRFAQARAPKPEPPRGRAVVVELDEMWRCLKKSRASSGSGRLGIALQGDWLAGNAAAAIALPARAAPLKRVSRWRPRLHGVDGWQAYAGLIPQGQLHVGKDETQGLGRDHARRRRRPARFRRRSTVAPKAKRVVDASVALFARFGGNGRIGDLFSMQT